MKNCADCAKRDKCVELCAEVNEYAEQDYRPGEEFYIDPHIIEATVSEDWNQRLVSSTHLTKTEKKIVTLMGLGLSRENVCEVLKMNRQTLRSHIRRLRQKARE